MGYRVESGGHSVVIAGDTVPCEGLDRLCAGADVYVQTVVRRSMIEPLPIPRLQDVLDYHSSIDEAATTAARAGVGTLVLTHLVPAPTPGTEQEWIDEAREIFDGEVVLAADLTTIDVSGLGPRPQRFEQRRPRCARVRFGAGHRTALFGPKHPPRRPAGGHLSASSRSCSLGLIELAELSAKRSLTCRRSTRRD